LNSSELAFEDGIALSALAALRKPKEESAANTAVDAITRSEGLTVARRARCTTWVVPKPIISPLSPSAARPH
jgi:hypothetical protein